MCESFFTKNLLQNYFNGFISFMSNHLLLQLQSIFVCELVQPLKQELSHFQAMASSKCPAMATASSLRWRCSFMAQKVLTSAFVKRPSIIWYLS